MKTPHVHADLIKQWAEGAQIQIHLYNGWKDITNPHWFQKKVYRVKPENVV